MHSTTLSKGKVERPFRDLKRGLLSEMDLDPPEDIGELNRRTPLWLARYVYPVAHGTTKVPPAERFAIEQSAARTPSPCSLRHRRP
jgi:hypothetical protein